MTTFIALYRGSTVATAELVTASSDPDLVAYVARQLLRGRREPAGDRALDEKRNGVRRALRIVRREAEERCEDDAGHGQEAP